MDFGKYQAFCPSNVADVVIGFKAQFSFLLAYLKSSVIMRLLSMFFVFNLAYSGS